MTKKLLSILTQARMKIELSVEDEELLQELAQDLLQGCSNHIANRIFRDHVDANQVLEDVKEWLGNTADPIEIAEFINIYWPKLLKEYAKKH